MEEKKIILNYDRSHYLEIYSNDGRLKYLSIDLFGVIISFLISTSLFVFFLILYKNSVKNHYFECIIFSFIFLIFSSYYLFKGIITNIIKIKDFKKIINRLDKMNYFELILKENSFVLNTHDGEFIFNISTLMSVEIYENYLVTNYNSGRFPFPKKSFYQEDFLFFKDWIRLKLDESKIQITI